MNVFGVRPGEMDQGSQGSSSKFGFCIAENEEDSPWEPLHVERGFEPQQSTVTAFLARSMLHVEQRHSQEPEVILSTVADSMAYAGALDPGHGLEVHRPGGSNSVAVLGPEHAGHIATRGWSKQDARQCLWEHFGRTAGELRRVGKPWGLRDDEPDDAFIRFARSPESLTVVVAGYNCGISSVITTSGVIATKVIEE